ncbi:MAG: hypothetical protein V3V21_09905, partial [Thermoplasmata archaeon]
PGPQGLQGIQGPSGVVTSAFTSGPGTNPTATRDFLAPFVTVSVVAGQDVFVVSHKAFGSIVPGGASSLDLFICYRDAGSAAVPTTVGNGALGTMVPQSTRILMGLSAVIENLATGSWEVSLCGHDNGNGNWNNNEWGYTSAIVYQT